MRKLSLLLVFLLIFSSVYLPIGVSADETNGRVERYWPAPDVTPPNVHPRVFFTQDKIAGIRNNIEAEENAIAKDLFLKYVNVGLSESGITDKIDSQGRKVYDVTVLAQIEACAFYYAIYKGTALDAKAQKAGQEAVDSIEIIKAMEVTTTNDPQRQNGRKLNVLSEVYDWCYPLIKDDSDLINDILNTGMTIMMSLSIWDGVMEDRFNGKTSEEYNPYYSLGGLGPVAGHGVEKENLRDLLSFAIAFSDRRPDVWESFGGRFYSRYVPARKELFKSGYYHSGTDYGICREYAVACAYFLITGMGLEEPWSGEDMARFGYANIYLRRPDGQYLYDGDIYTDTAPSFSYSENDNYNLMHMYAAAASSEDAGYFKNEYFKTGIKMSTAKLTQTFFESSPILNLIINNPEIEAKTVQNLPNSRYFPSPGGVMTARTGWEEGTKSSSVVANMKINEYDFNDHMHLDSGHFSIYYKGLLATDGGNYKTVTTDEYKMYTKKSIAHNTMLVYDPSEDTGAISTANVNDGGQILKYNATPRSIEKLWETSKASEVLAHEIDPENTQRPYYTYIKGELENSYSDKVEEFKRSFMFLDLKDENFPAALIVFDKVVSSDAKFKKMWLLHGVDKPTVDETNKVTTFTNINSSYSYNGQMVNKTLLPKSAEFDVVGGRPEDGGDGWGVVRGWQYNDTTGKWDITNSVDYGANTTASRTESNERNTYRLEVSPSTPNKEDHFLNVILVGDAGEQIDANVPLYEDNTNFYGTMVEDRVVFFSRDGAKKSSFSYNLSGSGTKRYTICDMEKGTYTVTVGGSSKEVSVSEEGGVLSFTGSAGQVSTVKKNDTYTKPKDAPYEVLNDRAYIKKTTRFYNSGEQQTDGIVAEAESFAELFGHTTVTTTENSKVVTKIYDGIELVATVREGDAKIQTKKGTINSSVTPYLNEEGKLIMNLTELSRLLNSESRYLDYAKTFYIYNLTYDPEDIYASGNIRDGSLTVNVKVNNGFNTDIYCGIVKGDGLVIAQKLEEVSVGGADANGCYTTSIDVSKLEDYEVKLYAWGDELYPIKDAMIMEEANLTDELNGYKFHTALESDLYENENMTVSRNGSKWVFKRSADVDDYSDVFAFTRQADTHQISDGFLHYSTNLRINKISNENETIETSICGATIITRTHPTFEGAEYKIDVVVDFKGKMAYVFENGANMRSGSVRTWDKFDSVEHYIVNNSGTFSETEFELFDTTMRYYPTTFSLTDIRATFNKFLILK